MRFLLILVPMISLTINFWFGSCWTCPSTPALTNHFYIQVGKGVWLVNSYQMEQQSI